MTEQPLRMWRRVGQVVALAGLGMLGIVDLISGLVGADYFLSSLAELGIAVGAGVLWLISHRFSARDLPIVAVLLALVSLAITLIPAVTTDANGSFGLAETTALLGLLVVVTRRADPLLALLGGPALAAAVIAQPLRGGSEYIFYTLLFVPVVGAAVTVGGYLRWRDTRQQRLLATVRSDQRAEFARDLHDFIAHHVTGIVVQAQGAQVIAAQDPQRVISALQQIERAGAETMASMRRMVGVLRDMDQSPDTPLAPLAGIAELGPLVEGFAAHGPPEARLHVHGRVDDLPVEVTSSTYRVVMEALTNVRRHAAGATAVDVVVHRADGWLLVRVSDDGHSPRAALPRELRRDGFGLMGLTERIRSLGGRIQAGPGIGGGWVVDAALPVAAPNTGPSAASPTLPYPAPNTPPYPASHTLPYPASHTLPYPAHHTPPNATPHTRPDAAVTQILPG